MDAMFFGDSDGSFFDFNSIARNRRLKYPMLPDRVSSLLADSSKVRIPSKQNGEIRVLSADIALMSSKKRDNDAAAIFINQMVPVRSKRYSSNIVYCETCEGLHTEDQALIIRRLFHEFSCDYIAMDCMGIGLGVYDALVRDIVDPDTGEVYPALTCCNDKEMADRCTTKDAPRVIWSIKGSSALNSECAILLREGFRSGKIKLLINEFDAVEVLKGLRGYNKLSQMDQLKLQAPYIHTTLLINELVKLEYEESGGKIKVHEKSGMRKDRYSSLSYNFYVATQLESKMSKYSVSDEDDIPFICRAPMSNGRKFR